MSNIRKYRYKSSKQVAVEETDLRIGYMIEFRLPRG